LAVTRHRLKHSDDRELELNVKVSRPGLLDCRHTGREKRVCVFVEPTLCYAPDPELFAVVRVLSAAILIIPDVE
jgi:hypothetical protein